MGSFLINVMIPNCEFIILVTLSVEILSGTNLERWVLALRIQINVESSYVYLKFSFYI